MEIIPALRDRWLECIEKSTQPKTCLTEASLDSRLALQSSFSRHGFYSPGFLHVESFIQVQGSVRPKVSLGDGVQLPSSANQS